LAGEGGDRAVEAMFRKPLPTTGAHKLGGSDEKKLRKQIVAAFPCATEEDAMELVPKKSELSLQKLAAPSRTQIYVGDGQPVFYDASGKGDLFPTVFALWRAPGILGEPVSVLGAPVTKFIVQGADLMLPGVGRVPPIDFGRGRLFAVVVPGNPAPIAIGEAEMSSAEVRDAGGAGGKGRFLRILTSYRDALWDYAASR
jgi:translation initiation factor 2D